MANLLDTIIDNLKKIENLMKSNFKISSDKDKKVSIYDEKANINRKISNVNEVPKDVGPNYREKQYTTSGSSMDAARIKTQEKEQKIKSKKSLKVYTPEEIAEYEKKMGINKAESGVLHITTKDLKDDNGSLVYPSKKYKVHSMFVNHAGKHYVVESGDDKIVVHEDHVDKEHK